MTQSNHRPTRCSLANMMTLGQESGVGSRKSVVPRQLAKASNFDYSAPLLIENAQRERLEGEERPIGGVQNEGPFEFIIPPSEFYLQMSTMYLEITCRVVRENGANLHAGDDVAPINLLGSSLWEHVEVSLNDYNISGASASSTNYKAYIETLLSYNQTSIENVLRNQLFALDTPRFFDNCAHDGNNVGYINRGAMARNSRPINICAPICSDFLRTINHLAPGNKLSLKFFKARDAFLLHTDDARNYKIKIDDLVLHYARIRLAENIQAPSIERYPIDRTELKKYPVPQGLQTYRVNIHQGGPIPKHFIICQAATTAAEGTYDENPYNFQHFNIQKISISANGKRIPPNGLEFDFTQDPPNIARPYLHLNMNTGMWRQDKGNLVSLSAFKYGSTLVAFDRSTDLCNGYHIHQSDEGTVSLDISWSVALLHPITIFVYASYESVIVREKNHLDFIMETI